MVPFIIMDFWTREASWLVQAEVVFSDGVLNIENSSDKTIQDLKK